MSKPKRLIRSLLANSGYRLIRENKPYKPTVVDVQNRSDFLQIILPTVEHHAATGQWPTPDFLKGYFSPQRLAMVRLVLDQCDAEGVPMANRRIMDIGCHAGALLRLAGERYPGARLFGCDINETTLGMARRARPKAEVFFSSFTELPSDTKYDVAFFMQVLEHLVDPEAALQRLFELLDEGGTLVLTVPDGREDRFPAKEYDPRFGSYSGHVNFWSPEGWYHFLTRVAPEWRVRTAKLPTGQLFAAVTHIPAGTAVSEPTGATAS